MKNFKKNDLVTLVKVSDDKFGGNHPNEIYTGYKAEGFLFKSPKVGESIFLYNRIKTLIFRVFNTSVVTSIKGDIIKTQNSTYKISKVEQDKSNI